MFFLADILAIANYFYLFFYRIRAILYFLFLSTFIPFSTIFLFSFSFLDVWAISFFIIVRGLNMLECSNYVFLEDLRTFKKLLSKKVIDGGLYNSKGLLKFVTILIRCKYRIQTLYFVLKNAIYSIIIWINIRQRKMASRHIIGKRKYVDHFSIPI